MLHWLHLCDFSAGSFHMALQMACRREYIITLTAFVLTFLHGVFYMGPQIACVRGLRVTLVAFDCLFTNVFSNCLRTSMLNHNGSIFSHCFLKCAFERQCIVTLTAFVKLVSAVSFTGIPKSAFVSQAMSGN